MSAVHHGDCREIIPALGVTVDAVVTDPPYHLLPTAQRFGKPNSAPVTVPEFYANDGKSKGSSPYLRQSSGFMGQQWDGGDIAFKPETWVTIGSVLRPGGFLVAFGGMGRIRTWDFDGSRAPAQVWAGVSALGLSGLRSRAASREASARPAGCSPRRASGRATRT